MLARVHGFVSSRLAADGVAGNMLSALFAGGGIMLLRGVGAILTYASQIIVARSLPTADAGAFWLAMPAAMLASFALSLGFMLGAVRFVPLFIERDAPQFARGYLQQGMLFSCLTGGAVVMLAILAVTFGLAPPHSQQLVLAAAALCIPLTIHTFAIDYQRGLHRPVQAFVLQSLANPLLIAGGVFALSRLGYASAGAALTYTVFATILLAIGQLYLIDRSDGAWLFSRPAEYETRKWLRTGLPLAVTALVGNLGNWLDLFIVGLVLPIEQAAIYSVVGRILYILQFFGSAMTSGVAAQYSRLLHSGEHERMRRFAPKVTAIIVAANLLAAPLIISFRHEILGTFGPAFDGGATALAVLVAAQLVRCFIGPWDTLLYLAGHERLVTAITLISTACLGLGCLLFAPFFGIMGAAATSALVLTATAVAGWRFTRRRLDLDPSVLGISRRSS